MRTRRTWAALLAVPSIALAASVVGAAAAPTSAFAASTSPVFIDFAGDPSGGVANGFVSSSSPSISFADTSGSGLFLGDFGIQSHGQAIAALNDALEMRIARPVNRISFAFGNDDPSVAAPGLRAQLTLFRGATQIVTVFMTANLNDAMDQTILYEVGQLFDRAVFRYVDASGNSVPLEEAVDDIRTNPLCTSAGTEGQDILTGTPGDDVLCGGGGNDVLDGKGGNDLLFAGPGNDRVLGGPGADTVIGGLGNDLLSGGDGADLLRGLDGRDTLDGGPGPDRCEGGTGTDTGQNCEQRISIP